ncbi:MAG: hypothetical protein II661_01430 [Bacteroidales bacterium]|nr:hypothetical protein [Bacteroidales bacterium]
MLETLNDKRILERVQSYFEILKKTGYVKPGTTSRYLLYIFLYDFVDVLYDFMTGDDYAKINKILRSLFGEGNCLFPYNSTLAPCAHMGKPHYEGYPTEQITEDAQDTERYTEGCPSLRLH